MAAFQSGTLPVRCFDCEKKDKFFKLFQSYRPDHTWWDPETNKTKARLLCLNCELKTREDEWITWTAEEQMEMGADYATMPRILKDHKSVTKKGWQERADPLINARISYKALRDNLLQQAASSSSSTNPLECFDPPDVQVNFMQRMEQMSKEEVEDPDGMDVDETLADAG